MIDWNFTPFDQMLVVRLALAAFLSAAIGLERSLRGRAAGMRTHLAVALGSALFTVVGAYGFGKVAAPDRVAGQVVTGIGFLGAGTIWRHGASVEGLTSAASLWVVAAIGVACAAGMTSEAVLTTLMMLLTLETLRAIEQHLVRTSDEDGAAGLDPPDSPPPA